ncbi:MAG TPA: hypothetical protein VGJ82_19925 [Thermoanaerobaculia bacterium]
MRKDLLFTMLVLTLSTGCMSYIQQSTRAEMASEVKVLPADGNKHDFLVSVAGDFPRLRTAMGNPTAFHEIYFSSNGLHAEVYVGAAQHEIGKWGMATDGSITHRSLDAPTDRFDCLDRQPFTVDETTISLLPQMIKDAPRHTSLDDARLSMVYIRRSTGQFWWCGNVEIDMNFDGYCGAVYKDDDGDKYYDCPTGDVFYDTNGKFLRSTIDPNTHPAF